MVQIPSRGIRGCEVALRRCRSALGEEAPSNLLPEPVRLEKLWVGFRETSRLGTQTISPRNGNIYFRLSSYIKPDIFYFFFPLPGLLEGSCRAAELCRDVLYPRAAFIDVLVLKSVRGSGARGEGWRGLGINIAKQPAEG